MKTCTIDGHNQPNQSLLGNIYSLPRFRVSLVRENRAAAPSMPITTSVTAAALLAPCFKGIDREQFVICGLDAKHRIIGLNIVSVGSLTVSIVHPREVFKPLILMNACAALYAHNHPSGDPRSQPRRSHLNRPSPAGRRAPRHHPARSHHPW